MKTNLLKYIILFITVTIISSFISCSNKKVDEVNNENTITDINGTQEVKLGDTKARSGKEWPTMLPSNFPKFTKGNIITSQESEFGGNANVIIEISNVEEADEVKEYVQRIVNTGFKKQSYSEDEEDIGGILTKGSDKLTIGWNDEEKILDIVYVGEGK